MTNRILYVVISGCLVLGAFITGQLLSPRLHPQAPSKFGLPGGGHHCCYKPGYSTIVNPPWCPAPSVVITPENINSVCSCAPAQLWC